MDIIWGRLLLWRVVLLTLNYEMIINENNRCDELPSHAHLSSDTIGYSVLHVQIVCPLQYAFVMQWLSYIHLFPMAVKYEIYSQNVGNVFTQELNARRDGYMGGKIWIFSFWSLVFRGSILPTSTHIIKFRFQ